MKSYLNLKTLLLSGAVMLVAGTTYAQAQTIQKQTFVQQKQLENTRQINFAAMDLNGDGILSRHEVGGTLFNLFDADGNGVIDNLEYGKPRVLTIIPLEATQLTKVDLNDDGIADVTKYSTKEFAEMSMLNRFDKNNNGLSAKEFLNKSFLEADKNRDGTIDATEWRSVYTKSYSPKSAKQYRYNN